ncbi:MAG: nucleotidyl transferase AbiEii/AbiGii toxin family protein [Candidatus Nealsonbacteria bacterium]|nr:nucleotidyl transferase AbiEii/AbiGii toxin family protein [Candidatus Nealsonbacteria bacterium]
MKNKILTDKQISLLEEVGKSEFIARNFYLTGGTALAGFYLCHRYSEDLDFFSENEFDILQIDIALKKIKKKQRILQIDFQQSYNRNIFFLHFSNEIIKTEFTYFPFSRIEKGPEKYGIKIDSLIDIAVNKLFSIYQRNQARDYIDFYFIMKDKSYTVEDMIKKAKIKFDWHIDPLQLGSQFVKVKNAKDYPRMLVEISQKELENFFLKEAIKFKSKIIE